MIAEMETAELRARCAPGLHQRIKDAAKESARSISAEITCRLKRSFELEPDSKPKSAT
jgi:hypothetical protein